MPHRLIPLHSGEGLGGKADSPGQSWPEISLWLLDLREAQKHLPYYQKLLNAEDLQRAQRYTAEQARSTFILTRGRLRELLGEYLNKDPKELTLITNDHGKPRLAGTQENEGLVFNIAHSGDYALLAFGHDIALGVDIERVRERKNLEGLAKHCLTPNEWQRWTHLPVEEKLDEFIRYWVCKEAFVKATGRGLSLGCNKTGIDHMFTRFDQVPEDCGSSTLWNLFTSEVGDSYFAVVAQGKVGYW